MSSAAASDARAVRICILGFAIAAHGIVALALLRMDVPEIFHERFIWTVILIAGVPPAALFLLA